LYSNNLIMADLYTAGMTGSQFLTALNNRKIFNVLEYGAVGDDNTVNTTVLQAVIELAHAQGGSVYIPSGIYLTRSLTSYDNVKIFGDGADSVLKSTHAEVLLTEGHSLVNYATAGLHDIMLEGNNVGTIGYSTTQLAGFWLNNIYINQFTTCGLKLHGTLVGTFNNCGFRYNPIGVLAEIQGSPYSAPNLLTFKMCSFYLNSTWGISLSGGMLLNIQDCNFGTNGTNNNAATGAINYTGGSGTGTKYNAGLMVRGSWFEANYGTVININEPVATEKLVHNIDASLFILNDSEVAIKITGASTENKLILRSCAIQDTAGLIIDGANASVINQNSGIDGTISKANSGKYYTSDVTEV
jgi:hypothetical protein